MIQPSEDVLRAITNLDKSNPTSFKVFFDWLGSSWSGHLIGASVTENDVHSRWMQGRCQELRDLIQFISTAEMQLEAQRVADIAKHEPITNRFD